MQVDILVVFAIRLLKLRGYPVERCKGTDRNLSAARRGCGTLEARGGRAAENLRREACNTHSRKRGSR
eukprot:SAG11_NODE_1869_length_4151_cov_5.154245_5_plen_68_part_00